MHSKRTSTTTVFSIMMAAVALGLALGIPLGYAANYFNVEPFGLNAASGQNEQNQSKAVVDSPIK
jgi:prolipoprotein diacylglyceryltransferase